VLGPIAETSLRQGLMISQYNWSEFLFRPIAATLLVLAAASLLYGLYGQFIRASRRSASAGGSPEVAE
jgi:putative tricarboxylic transport membrane protein